MDAPPPPPPPPHGANPNTTEGTPRYRKSTDLPDGPYDIFVIPPHSAGSGFIYLPSLQCHRNSFIAGSISTLLVVSLWIQLQPMVKTWVATTNATGGMGVIVLVLAVGFGGWYFGTLQNDSGANGGSANRPRPGPGPGPGAGAGAGYAGGYQYGAQPNPGGPYPGGGPTPNAHFNAGNQYPPEGGPQPPPFNNHNNNQNNNHNNTHNAQPNSNAEDSKPKEDPKKAEAEWERAREETRRKEEIRRKMEAYKRKREAEEAEKRRQQEREAMEKELKQRKEELEREAAAAKAAAEKEIRERAAKEAAEREEKARKEAAEREEKARKEQEEREEKARKEAAEKEAAAKEAAKKEAAARFAAAKEAAAKKFAAAKEAAAKSKEASQVPRATASAPSAAPPPPRTPSPRKPPPPSARTAEEDDAYSFRPYDRPRRPYGTSAPSVYSESSYAPSQSTARTTPPPSHRAPYSTKDPGKVIIQGVYLFNNAFQKNPIAQLVSGQGSVTDGLILKITTEGLFIDDDVRGVAQREWDVKAWTLKSVETIKIRGLQIVRASVRDQEGKKYVFVVGEPEMWKVTNGLKRLKSGSQTRQLNLTDLPRNEGNTLLTNLGYN